MARSEGDARDRIEVFARIRPGPEEAVAALDASRLRVWRSARQHDAGLDFQFDSVVDVGATQKDVFERCRSVVRSFVEDGVPATLLAFGQTGSGKTYTMFGPSANDGSQWRARGDPSREGLTPRALREVFAHGVETVECSCLEVYQDNVYDLLSAKRKALDIQDDASGVRVRGLQVVEVRSLDQALHLLTLAAQGRTVAHNGVNAASSRAHTIFQLRVSRSGAALQLVDLAGSEKAAQRRPPSSRGGDAREEATMGELTSINQSLSCLGLCIAALCDRKRIHVPYRSSKLTRLLREALDSARGRVLLVVCISPRRSHCEETLSSLHFADRAKRAILAPRLPQTRKGDRGADATAAWLKLEIERLSVSLEV